MSEVVVLKTSAAMTPQQAIVLLQQEAVDQIESIVIQWKGKDGKFYRIRSAVNDADALWMAETLRHAVMLRAFKHAELDDPAGGAA